MSSRIIVKNLPKKVSDQDLMKHFSKYGTITDCTLKYAKNGNFRNFGFVGFTTNEEAENALKECDGSHLKSSKLKVEICKELKGKDKQRPWSKYSKGSSGYAKDHKAEIEAEKARQKAEREKQRALKKKDYVDEILGELKDDMEFREFLSVQKGKGVKQLEETLKATSDRSKVSTEVEFDEESDDEDEASDDKDDVPSTDEKSESTSRVPDTAHVESNGRLYVRNLPFVCTDDGLRDVFSEYGELSEVHVPVCRVLKRPKGFAFIQYKDQESAEKAMSALDGTVFMGRMLHIMPAEGKREEKTEVTEGGTFKETQLAKKKAKAGSSHNWNTLFLGGNAVADVMAARFQQKKSDILDATTHDSLGVRMALGETQIVAETRDFLIQNGVQLDAFSKPAAERSKSVILAKDLPANTEESTLREKFSKFGELLRVVLPPSGVAGLIEFADELHAKRAFKKLAYTMFYDRPLYLEWAPTGSFTGPVKVTKEEEQPKNIPQQKADLKQNGRTKILVRNVPWQANIGEIRELFKVFGELRFVRLPKKVMASKGSSHRGFAFVDFINQQDAKRAFESLVHSTHLYGRRLVLEWAAADETVEELRSKTAAAFGDDDAPKRKILKKSNVKSSLQTAKPS